MVAIEACGPSAPISAVAERLDASDGVRWVTLTEAASEGQRVVRAHAHPRAVGELIEQIRDLGIPDEDVVVSRVELVGWATPSRPGESLVWEDVIGTARVNARLFGRYLTFMFVGGVIGCYGVIDANGILIVGAMAISPDLLPIIAVAVGLVARRGALFGRALATVSLGLGVAVLAAVAFAFAQKTLATIPAGFNIDATVLGSLTAVNNQTVVIALAAGVAGMLALETRAMTAVGVAISVTTIPAAAYLGVSVGLGELAHVPGAAAVLAVNVVMMIAGASGVLILQRAFGRGGVGGV